MRPLRKVDGYDHIYSTLSRLGMRKGGHEMEEFECFFVLTTE